MAQKNGRTGSFDWFLIAIIVGVVALVGLTLLLVFRDSAPPAFRPDDTPEGVAYNYYLAIQQKAYERAYGYLSSETPDFPADAADFFDAVQADWNCTTAEIDRRTYEVAGSEVFDDRAVVTMSETVYSGGGGLFSSGRFPAATIRECIRAAGIPTPSPSG